MSRLYLVLVLLTCSTACTVRYSQSLVGRITPVQGTPISNSDAGTEVGLGTFGGLQVIAFSEPLDAKTLATKPCPVQLTQVDYRGTWYAFYLAVNFPEVGTRVVCEAKP